MKSVPCALNHLFTCWKCSVKSHLQLPWRAGMQRREEAWAVTRADRTGLPSRHGLLQKVPSWNVLRETLRPGRRGQPLRPASARQPARSRHLRPFVKRFQYDPAASSCPVGSKPRPFVPHLERAQLTARLSHFPLPASLSSSLPPSPLPPLIPPSSHAPPGPLTHLSLSAPHLCPCCSPCLDLPSLLFPRLWFILGILASFLHVIKIYQASIPPQVPCQE